MYVFITISILYSKYIHIISYCFPTKSTQKNEGFVFVPEYVSEISPTFISAACSTSAGRVYLLQFLIAKGVQRSEMSSRGIS